ncbi:MAG: DUF4383 domain-containing protein [Actinomycetota bacterium]|nr:DUF4383 domain-containing protein [Actinomycetota bacterium]
MLLRRYAQILGVVLILVGLLGLLLGERVWLGVLNVDLFEDIVHLVTGGLLAFVGFSERGVEYARSVVGGLGVVYLLVGLLGFVTPALFGLLPHGYSVFDNLLHLALGIASIAVVFYSQAGRTAGRHGPRVARR